MKELNVATHVNEPTNMKHQKNTSTTKIKKKKITKNKR
jgi:hypothetical protein